MNDLAKKGISIATPHLQERLAGLKTIAELVSLDPFRGWVMAMVATYGLRNHEIWHVNASNAEPMSGWVRISSCSAPLQVMLCLRAKASTRSKVSLFMAARRDATPNRLTATASMEPRGAVRTVRHHLEAQGSGSPMPDHSCHPLGR